MEQLSIDQVCAVITSYFPDELLIQLTEQAAAQTSQVIIVDNTGSTASDQILNSLKPSSKILVIKNPENAGLGTALNKGIAKAKELGYRWILTLDQDSEIAGNLVEVYQKFVAAYPYPEQLGIVSSNCRDKYSGLLIFPRKAHLKTAWAEITSLITSGCFFSIATFETVNGFRENFLLDWVDYDFCLKIRQKGKHNYIYLDPLMTHRLGFQTLHNVLFFKLHATHHSPLRCYLIGRNFVVLIREYLFKEFFYILRLMVIVTYKPISILFFEKNKGIKLGAFFKGMRDGIRQNHYVPLRDLARTYSSQITAPGPSEA